MVPIHFGPAQGSSVVDLAWPSILFGLFNRNSISINAHLYVFGHVLHWSVIIRILHYRRGSQISRDLKHSLVLPLFLYLLHSIQGYRIQELLLGQTFASLERIPLPNSAVFFLILHDFSKKPLGFGTKKTGNRKNTVTTGSRDSTNHQDRAPKQNLV